MGSRKQISSSQKFYLALSLMAIILATGTTGYSLIEGWSLLDSAYMTVITLTTIGFQEVHPLSDGGRLFTIIIVLCSVTILAYTANLATRMIASGEIKYYMDQRKMRRSMEKMRNHFIICGFGRTGKRVCELFKLENVDCVVVERDSETAEQVRNMGIPVIEGEATDEDVLCAAGLEHARCLITAVDSPADNVFITLTARDLNPDIHIVSRAQSAKTGAKLRRAGADRVVYPHQIGGRSMAQAALRPTLDRFLSMDTLREKYGVYMEEIHIGESSELVGQRLMQASISQRFGLTIIAILGKDQHKGSVTFNPGSDSIIHSGDTLIVVGKEEQLHRLSDVASGKQPAR